MKKLVDDIFRGNVLSWNMVSVVCSDEAPAVLRQNSGFGALVKADAPHIIVMHSILHRHELAMKTLPLKLADILKIVVECVNYIRRSAMEDIIFKEMYNKIGSQFGVLLYHSNVWLLSQGKVLNHVISLVFARAPTLSCRLLKKF